MADIHAPQARILATARVTAETIDAPQFRGLTAINFPTKTIAATQGRLSVAVRQAADIDVTQGGMLAVARGRISNPRIRAWPFSLDGHDFYVLRLGDEATVVFDLTTGQWFDWASPERPTWCAHLGTNWLGMGSTSYARGFTTDVIAGDDSYGLLWILAPESGVDEMPDGRMVAFERLVTGGVPMAMRQTAPCGGVYLTMSLGEPAQIGASITLRTSDDLGKTWVAHETLTVTPGDWTQDISWRSLGLIRAPGRIFELSDNGAAVRIGSLDMK